MPYIDSMIFKKKGVKRSLKLILEENENILTCIKQGMKEHNLSEVQILSMTGKIKEGIMSYLNGSKYVVYNFDNNDVMLAGGQYKLSFGELFGSLRITVKENKIPINGVFSKGKAAEGLEINLEFTEFVDQ
ncbi:MAG: hypothetical protein V1672_04715 [Candidatus Diapherotrites archaeon]